MGCRVALLIGVLFQLGCAAFLNSDRPEYHGPIQAAAWHNASVQVEQTPVILDRAVYAIARPMAIADSAHVYAFDLETGKEVWHSAYGATRVIAADASGLIVTDSENGTHVLDPVTGRDLAVPESGLAMGRAAFSGGRLYAVRPGEVEALSPPNLASQWSAAIPLDDALAPAVAGGRVYVLGTARGKSMGLYAFDAQTGAAAWKWELPDRVGSFAVEGLTADEGGVYVWLRQTGRDSFSKGLLIAFDAASGNEKWRHSTSGNPAFEALLLAPGEVVIPDYPAGKEANSNSSGYIFRALNRRSGLKVWEVQTAWKYSLVSFDGNLLLVSDRKVHQLLNENNETSPDSWVSVVELRTGKELWRSPIMELAVLTRPAASANVMVAGSKPYSFNDVRGKDSVAGLWAWRLRQ